MIHILVLEDDSKLNKFISAMLRANGFEVFSYTNAIDAFDAMTNGIIDLIITDIMMPEIDGFEFAKQVRLLDKNIPIIFMTARDDISAKQKGFSIGIDDYIVKPVIVEELVLRIGALLRRANIENEKKIIIGDLTLDASEMSASLSEEEIPITVKEFNIIFKLLSYPKQTFTRAQLKDEFWGVEVESTLRSVDVYINKLRDKFANCKDFEIVTVHGLGYKAVLK